MLSCQINILMIMLNTHVFMCCYFELYLNSEHFLHLPKLFISSVINISNRSVFSVTCQAWNRASWWESWTWPWTETERVLVRLWNVVGNVDEFSRAAVLTVVQLHVITCCHFYSNSFTGTWAAEALCHKWIQNSCWHSEVLRKKKCVCFVIFGGKCSPDLLCVVTIHG